MELVRGSHSVLLSLSVVCVRFSFLLCLMVQGLLEDLHNAAPGSIVVFQTCAHNPTGVDPSKEDWQKILEVVQSRQLLPFFDSAYQVHNLLEYPIIYP